MIRFTGSLTLIFQLDRTPSLGLVTGTVYYHQAQAGERPVDLQVLQPEPAIASASEAGTT